MKRLGRVLHSLKSGLIIVKLQGSSSPPAIGSSVLSKEGGVVGVVRDVIGRVDSPYVVVKPLKGQSRKPVTELYFVNSQS
ncbi:MAG: hypothetical protein QXT74_01090 [Candidatus Nezhaarchaeales archaeon]